MWRPDRPALYDLALELVSGGTVVDRVQSYFGQRKVSLHDGKMYLNNEPFFLRLALDQGYWPESILTPPTDEAIQYDIRMTKAFGLNGVRKHQKAEDPRFLYWADKMGLVVWGEMANAYAYSPEYVARFTAEWEELVARDYNHPSIVAWVPINESWGVPQILTDPVQQAHAKAMYQLVKSLDPMRPVVDNDGWEHTDQTDLMTIHDYARTGDELSKKYAHLTTEPSRIPRNGREALVARRQVQRVAVRADRVRRDRLPRRRQGGRERVGLQRRRAHAGGVSREARRLDQGRPGQPCVGRLLLHAADRRGAGDQRADDIRPQAEGGAGGVQEDSGAVKAKG